MGCGLFSVVWASPELTPPALSFYSSSFQAGVVDVDRHLLGKKDRRELGTRMTLISPKPDGKKKKSKKGSEHSK